MADSFKMDFIGLPMRVLDWSYSKTSTSIMISGTWVKLLFMGFYLWANLAAGTGFEARVANSRGSCAVSIMTS